MRNPFITDRPLTEADPFYGRDDLFQRLQDHLLEGARFFLLFGKYRIGKTSFLNQLPLRLGSRYEIYFLDWERAPSPTLSAPPLQVLLGKVAAALGKEAPPSIGNDLASLKGALQALQGVPEGRVTLFCVDALPIRALEDAQWARALEMLAEALRDTTTLAILMAIEGMPEEMSKPLEVLPGRAIVLRPFLLDDTSEMLMFILQGILHFDPESVRRIHVLSGGEPLFIQHFGQILFEARKRHGWVILPDVDRAAEEIVQKASAEFEALWQAANPLERVVLCVFAERIGNQGLGTAEDVLLQLARARVRLAPEAVNDVLDRLKRHGILEELGGRTFRIRNGLFFLWIKKTQSLVAAIRRAPGIHPIRERAFSPWQRKRIDWVSLLLSIVAILLIGAIAYVWRSREAQILWTATPTQEVSEDSVPSPMPSVTPERSVLGGTIVYIAKAAPRDKWAIYKMRADGSDPVRLTHDAANDTAPAVSPDGRRIAFVSDRDSNREIYVMNADGSDQQNLTRNSAEDWTPAWSPDGKQIAFASYRDGNWELYVMNADGSNPKRLTRHSASDYSPAWSPDGERIAFVSDRDGNLEIYILEVATGAVARFTKDPATDQAPTWTPNGQEITWETYRDGNMEIYSAALDGSNLRNLSQDAYANDHGASWAPWGRYLIWYSNRDKGWDIYRLDTETGERVNLTMSTALEQWPHWGP